MKQALILFFAMAVPASGNLVFTLSPSALSGQPGGAAAIFQGTLLDTDTDGSFLFLNDILVTFASPGSAYLSVDPPGQPASSPNSFFFNTVPGDLIGDGVPVDDSYTGPVFEVFAAPGTPGGTYSGTISILGGFNGPEDTDVLATEGFQVTTPEPGSLGLALTGLLCLGLAVRFRRA